MGEPPDVPHTFLVEAGEACKGRDIQVIAYVHSAISRVQERAETRRTWAGSGVLNMTVVFVVGRARSQLERDIIAHESSTFNDIVQVCPLSYLTWPMSVCLSIWLSVIHVQCFSSDCLPVHQYLVCVTYTI